MCGDERKRGLSVCEIRMGVVLEMFYYEEIVYFGYAKLYGVENVIKMASGDAGNAVCC